MSTDVKAGLQSIKNESGDAYEHLKCLIVNMATGEHGLDSFEK